MTVWRHCSLSCSLASAAEDAAAVGDDAFGTQWRQNGIVAIVVPFHCSALDFLKNDIKRNAKVFMQQTYFRNNSFRWNCFLHWFKLLNRIQLLLLLLLVLNIHRSSAIAQWHEQLCMLILQCHHHLRWQMILAMLLPHQPLAWQWLPSLYPLYDVTTLLILLLLLLNCIVQCIHKIVLPLVSFVLHILWWCVRVKWKGKTKITLTDFPAASQFQCIFSSKMGRYSDW